MNLTVESSLACFNRLVLKSQDEAYTLAWYLFGSEAPAAAAVQAAVERLYRNYPVDETNFRIRLLHLVWQQGKQCRPHLPVEDGYPLRVLSRRQAQLLLLVSVLALDYRQAAEVIGCSEGAVGREIAAARQALVFPLAVYAPQPQRIPLS